MKQPLLVLVAVLLALMLPQRSFAQRAFLPVDHAARQPDFFTFRAQLQVAIAKRDIDFVLSVLSKNIMNSFGGTDGVNEFKEKWQPESRESGLWPTLATVLALGGTFGSEASFTAPYTFSIWPSDLNGFQNIVVIGSNVRVRAQPSINAPVLGSLGHSIVELGDVKDWEAQWYPVRLSGGKLGFVDKRFLRSPIDYRATFEKLEGRWQMTALVAGD
jgi:hypothetical protein